MTTPNTFRDGEPETGHDIELVLRDGTVRGRGFASHSVFYGIPYAAPPVGAARFELPAPPAAWRGVRDATRPGPTAPQPPRGMFGALDLTDYFTPGWVRGADYLTVNVIAPPLPTTRASVPGAPVLVFLHGGGFIAGSSYVPLLDGRSFAENGIVVVTVNYRLGLPGFLDLPGAPRNRGLTDVTAALNWVRTNITAFGGDPDQVTLGGQSAGAILTAALIAANPPGLFQRAIMHSGTGTGTFTTEQARIVREAAAGILGIDPTLAEFARIDDDRLADAVVKLVGTDLRTETARDPLQRITPLGIVLDEQPVRRIERGEGATVELLIGHNSEEGNLYLVPAGTAAATSDADLLDAAAYACPDPRALVHAYRQIHPHASPGQLRSLILGDAAFGIGTRAFADAHATAGRRTFAYQFTWRSTALDGRLGATHVVDVPFAFNTVRPALVANSKLLGAHMPPVDLAERMHRTWVRFVKTASPGWPSYDSSTRSTMRIDEQWTLVTDPYRAERSAWASTLDSPP